ncbi:MAG: 1-deoxy-D-xylulose-5-phosphate synthase [Campylobacterales bacterium]|nr:1-deoxy-D-xylulose-5-phosphate synthase [Campylobacterales bacterium]
MNIKQKNHEELKEICHQIREKILATVSKNGGHLSSNIGAVELTVAMHYVFDVEKDPFIFDVSHQCYAHKLLTGRWDSFDTLRQFGGVSGYTKPSESSCDYFIAGHSSTSISLAIGAAKAIRLKQEDRLPVVLIGDGSMTAGMVYEALNELGDRKYPVVIILNDNEMSIAKPIGAVSKYLSQAMAGKFYQKIKQKMEQFLTYLPEGASYMAKKFEESLKLITPGLLFEELGLEYIGPVDGHDLESLIETLQIAKEMGKPVIVHAQTLKGKGYEKAEGYYEKWHGVGPFDLKSGESLGGSPSSKNATQLFSEGLLRLATQHENVVGVTAAMPSGTGMDKLMEKYPERFWDVAIAEQHAVTSMAAMAKEGFKPFIAIYSTFLQRAYDQIIHDCCLMNLNVVFAIDRAGIVGEDGETHQGAFDISFLHPIPNMTLFAPRCAQSMHYAIDYAYTHVGPCAFRYPRGTFMECGEHKGSAFELGKGEMLEEGEDAVFIGYGKGVGRAWATKQLLAGTMNPALVDLKFIKPLDDTLLVELANRYHHWYVFSDSAARGGVGSILTQWLFSQQISTVHVESFEYTDAFIQHGKTSLVEEDLGLCVEVIARKLKNNLGSKNY